MFNAPSLNIFEGIVDGENESEIIQEQKMPAALANIGIEQLPSLISEQYNSIVNLENKVNYAMKSAQRAKDSADSAASKSAKFGHKKEAIQALQSFAVDSAESTRTLVDAQKESFEYQRKLTEISQGLLMLGLGNIAMNRTVVRELEKKLENASEEEISELARQELMNVVSQLNAQKDMMEKQNFITSELGDQADKLERIDIELDNINQELDKIDKTDVKQDKQISANRNALNIHQQALSEQREKDQEHDRRLDDMDKTDIEQDKRLDEIDITDERQDQKIADNASRIAQHDVTLIAHYDRENELEEKIQALSLNTADNISALKSFITQGINETNKSFNSRIDSLIAELEAQKKTTDDQIDNLNTITSKKLWKVSVTIIAVASLALNILQIVGIL